MAVVALTGFTADDAARLKHTLGAAGHTTVESLTSKTAVLVVAQVGTPKHRAAQQHGIPCVTEHWATQGLCRVAAAGEYPVPRLLGAGVALVGFAPSELTIARRAVVRLAGRVVSSPQSARCTHLVAHGTVAPELARGRVVMQATELGLAPVASDTVCVTFASVPAKQRHALAAEVELLGGTVLSRLVLGGAYADVTTHLVVPDAEAAQQSPKVAAVVSRAQRFGQHEAAVVAVSWVEASAAAGRFLPTTAHVVDPTVTSRAPDTIQRPPSPTPHEPLAQMAAPSALPYEPEDCDAWVPPMAVVAPRRAAFGGRQHRAPPAGFGASQVVEYGHAVGAGPRGGEKVRAFISNGLRDEAPHLELYVQELRGSVVLQAEDCTHFVTARPAKTETFFVCLAAGRWVVTTEWVQQSRAAGKWLDPLPFEWTLAHATAVFDSPPSATLAALIDSCAVRRDDPVPPFAGLVVWLRLGPDRNGYFEPVLQAGGAVVRLGPRCPPDVTIVIADPKVAAQLEGIPAGVPVERGDHIVRMLCQEHSEARRTKRPRSASPL